MEPFTDPDADVLCDEGDARDIVGSEEADEDEDDVCVERSRCMAVPIHMVASLLSNVGGSGARCGVM